MTVAELVEALQKMPPDLKVTRYSDEIVEGVELRYYGRADTPDSSRTDDLVGAYEHHVALW